MIFSSQPISGFSAILAGQLYLVGLVFPETDFCALNSSLVLVKMVKKWPNST